MCKLSIGFLLLLSSNTLGWLNLLIVTCLEVLLGVCRECFKLPEGHLGVKGLLGVSNSELMLFLDLSIHLYLN